MEQIIITAIDDWTTFDTIGGYFPSVDEEGHEIVVGKNGKIVNSVVECCNTIIDCEKRESTNKKNNVKKQASWLVIDELNRCEIDKIFGDFLTIFGGSDDYSDKIITLEFQSVPAKRELCIPDISVVKETENKSIVMIDVKNKIRRGGDNSEEIYKMIGYFTNFSEMINKHYENKNNKAILIFRNDFDCFSEKLTDDEKNFLLNISVSPNWDNKCEDNQFKQICDYIINN